MWTVLSDKTERTTRCHTAQHADDIEMFADALHQCYLREEVASVFQVGVC